MLSSIDGFDDSNGSSQRLELYGQYMAATNAGGVGVYGSLPVSRVSIDGDSESEIGNPEFGGLYAPRIAGAELVLRAGISPSLHDENDNGGFVNLLSSFGRLTDFIAQAPGTTMLRLSGSPMLRSGNIVARADLGFDIPLSSDGGLDADAVARFNLAIGADLGQLVVAGELVNLVNLGGDGDSEFLHTLGMSGHLKLGTVQPFASLVIPLDESLRDLIDFALAFGVRFTPT